MRNNGSQSGAKQLPPAEISTATRVSDAARVVRDRQRGHGVRARTRVSLGEVGERGVTELMQCPAGLGDEQLGGAAVGVV